MKISEVIRVLETIRRDQGDLPVFIKQEDDDYNLLVDTVPSLDEYLPNGLDLENDDNWLPCVIFRE